MTDEFPSGPVPRAGRRRWRVPLLVAAVLVPAGVVAVSYHFWAGGTKTICFEYPASPNGQAAGPALVQTAPGHWQRNFIAKDGNAERCLIMPRSETDY